jgi:DNA-binding NarL/FixJ family response regulator
MKTTVGVAINEPSLRHEVISQLNCSGTFEIAFESLKEDSFSPSDCFFNKLILITDEQNLNSERFIEALHPKGTRFMEIILISSKIELPRIKDYFEMGIRGFVSKTSIHLQLIDAILSVSQEKLFTKGLLH